MLKQAAEELCDQVLKKIGMRSTNHFVWRKAADYCAGRAAKSAKCADDEIDHHKIRGHIKKTLIYTLAADIFREKWRSAALEAARIVKTPEMPHVVN